MTNPQIKTRLKPDLQKTFNKIKAELGLTGVYGEDSQGLQACIILAHKHLKLKARLKELFNDKLDF